MCLAFAAPHLITACLLCRLFSHHFLGTPPHPSHVPTFHIHIGCSEPIFNWLLCTWNNITRFDGLGVVVAISMAARCICYPFNEKPSLLILYHSSIHLWWLVVDAPGPEKIHTTYKQSSNAWKWKSSVACACLRINVNEKRICGKWERTQQKAANSFSHLLHYVICRLSGFFSIILLWVRQIDEWMAENVWLLCSHLLWILLVNDEWYHGNVGIF